MSSDTPAATGRRILRYSPEARDTVQVPAHVRAKYSARTVSPTSYKAAVRWGKSTASDEPTTGAAYSQFVAAQGDHRSLTGSGDKV